MLCSVIIPTMKGREEMLAKLISTIPKHYEIIVVDDENLLLAAKRNKGARKSHGEYLFFVDDDNYLAPGAIEEALWHLENRLGIGVVGFMASYDNRLNHVADGGSLRNHLTGFTYGVNTNAWWPFVEKQTYEVDEVANAFMIHSDLFYELHGFDEVNFPMDMNESDLCKRVKDRGLKIMMCPTARCYHKSQTYSPIPNFRKEMYAYFHGRGRIGFSRKHYHGLRYWCHISVFLPLFFSFYTASLLWRGNFKVIVPFWKGISDGLSGRLKNKYQS